MTTEQRAALEALDDAGIVAADCWVVEDGDLVYVEDYDEPGWRLDGDLRVVSLHWGCLDFRCDVIGSGVVETARRLLAAVEAWNA